MNCVKNQIKIDLYSQASLLKGTRRNLYLRPFLIGCCLHQPKFYDNSLVG